MPPRKRTASGGAAPHDAQDTRPLEKWDIFHYVYAVLHHPTYRQRFAEVLK